MPAAEPAIVSTQRLAQLIDQALPQTQCTRCGYADCSAYAQAIAQSQADINLCPPGGAEGVQRLAQLTQRPVRPLNPEHGVEGPRQLAIIDEDWCIGCTLCLEACPTDAIVGSHKWMHTVIAEHCTGCELCIPVCPVDCIQLRPVSGEKTGWQAWSVQQADAARERYARHKYRLEQAQHQRQQRHQAERQAKLADLPAHSRIQDPAVLDQKRRLIEAAMARAEQARAVKPR